MITYNSSGGYFRITVQGDAKNASTVYLYTLSRSMLSIQRSVAKMAVVTLYLQGGGISFFKMYYTDPNGKLEIPLKNYVNKFYDAGVTSVTMIYYFNELDGSAIDTAPTYYIEPRLGISYQDMLAPKNKDVDGFSYAKRQDVILPPNVIIRPDTVGFLINQAPVVIETNYHDHDVNAAWAQTDGGTDYTITPTGDFVTVNMFADSLKLTSGASEKVWTFEKPDDCTNLVVIQWTSLTGVKRQHFFPVVSLINANDNEISIVEAGNGYDIRKNAYKGAKCRLCGLTPYGCWYYQDLLQASDAHAIIKQTWATFADEMASMETACLVEGGMEATPEGNGFFNFEFTLKLRHYDTF